MATTRTFSIEIFFAVSNFLKMLKVIVKVSRISCVEGPLATPLDDRILLRLNLEITQNFTNGKIHTRSLWNPDYVDDGKIPSGPRPHYVDDL